MMMIKNKYDKPINIDGPFSEKWNQIAIFKNANKLHKSSWKGVNIDRTPYFFTYQSNIFLFTCSFCD